MKPTERKENVEIFFKVMPRYILVKLVCILGNKEIKLALANQGILDVPRAARNDIRFDISELDRKNQLGYVSFTFGINKIEQFK